jgi:cytoskeletal protein RodZ
MKQFKSRTGGFAILQLVLLIFIIAAVVGIGVWVFQQRDKSTTTSEATVATSSSTSQNVINDVQNEAGGEKSVDQSNANNEASQAGVSASTVTQVGDSANAATY